MALMAVFLFPKLFGKAMLTNGIMPVGSTLACHVSQYIFALLSLALSCITHLRSWHQQSARYVLHIEHQSNSTICALDHLHIAGRATSFGCGDRLIIKIDWLCCNHKHPAYLGISTCWQVEVP
jgi:hypothetical protein